MSVTEAERFLLSWHAQRPGETARVLADVRDPGGLSSYDHLLAAVGPIQPAERALDLCCGDGYLLERLLDAGVGEATGVDLSPEELAGARARLGERARLFEGRAQELPFEDASFDLVTCHLALMLLQPVEPVLAELRRVLRPGGRFVFVVGGPGVPCDLWSRLIARYLTLPRRSVPIGDPRTRSEAGLRGLLADFEQVSVQDFVVGAALDPATVWAQFLSTYNPDFVSEDAMQGLSRVFWEELVPDPEAPSTASQGRRLVRALRPAGP